MRKEQIKSMLRDTDLTNQQIRKKVGCRGQLITDTLKEMGNTFATDRKRRMYKRSKIGSKNPMKGKFGKKHHNYIGAVSDSKGYILVLKPEWFTGRKGSKHVFFHSYVCCKYMGLTEIPKGNVVHHCDCDPLNNDFSNLVVMTMGEHAALHHLIKGATTISKESTLKWVEARRTGNSCDIV